MKRAVIGSAILITAVILFSFDAAAQALRVESLDTTLARAFYIPVFSIYFYFICVDNVKTQKNRIKRRIYERKKELKEKFEREYEEFFREYHGKRS